MPDRRHRGLLITVSALAVALAAIAAYLITHRTDAKAQGPRNLNVGVSLADDLCSWEDAGEDFKQSKQLGGLRRDVPTFKPSDEEQSITAALWSGDVVGSAPPLQRQLRTDTALHLMNLLRKVKANYENGYPRTSPLDAVWRLIPTEPRTPEDLVAFQRFARHLYPDRAHLDDQETIARQQALVECLRELWKLPEDDDELGASEAIRDSVTLFYDVLCWRTRPFFRLSIANPNAGKIEITTVETVVDAFEQAADACASGPIQDVGEAHFLLKGNAAPMLQNNFRPVGIRAGDIVEMLLRYESEVKGIYTVHVVLKSGDKIVGQTAPFNLCFFN